MDVKKIKCSRQRGIRVILLKMDLVHLVDRLNGRRLVVPVVPSVRETEYNRCVVN
jgi:hypothetical protein